MGTTLRVASIAAGGAGVSRLPDGRAVFIPRTAPGDLVELGVVREHRNWAEADLARVIEPAASRALPKCGHYVADRCGGCQLQHLDEATQRRAKSSIVGEALRRIGRLDVTDPEVQSAPLQWGYRHKITVHQDSAGRIGFHPLGRPAETFDLARCEIAEESLNRLWTEVSRNRALLPQPVDALVLRRARDGSLHVGITPARPRARWRGAAELRNRLKESGFDATVWVTPAASRRGQPVARESGQLPPHTFEQVAPGLAGDIRAWAVEQLGPVSGRHLWDLYAGVGETTALLLGRGATVESVELDPDAVAASRKRNPGAGSGIHEGRVEAMLRRLLPPHAVVTNPPRTGMDSRAVDALSAVGPARIAYVSCDPATLARDLRRLGGYRLIALRAFDLFPQTAHVESVALLERA
ncbi:MAG: class I SAM-dependent RNA methyltransferase [Gemmatimonadales bacterium]